MADRRERMRPRSSRRTPSPKNPTTAAPDDLNHGTASVPPPGDGLTRRDGLGLLALGLLVAISYFPATQAGFVWDDSIITTSKAVREWSGLWQLWFDTANTYRFDNTREGHFWPVMYSTFWLEHKIWGFSPTGYHVVNLLLHFANTCLVWRLFQRTPGGWLIAAVFAVHPVHVEAVAWVIGRKDLLSTLFYLAAALTWLRFVDTPRAGLYILALTFFVAALLSKSIAVTLPAGLLIWHWWQQGRVSATDVLRLLPFFIVGLGIGLADMAFYQRRETVFIDLSVVERLLISARALWFYVGKLLWPTDLAVIYPRWYVDPMAAAAWAYVGAAGAAAALLWFFRERVGRGTLAGAAFFAVTLSPVLGLVYSTYMQWSFVADRYQYLASLGLIAVFVGAAVHGTARLSGAWRNSAVALAGVLLTVLGALTWQQAGIYRDDVTFHRHIIALNPLARDAHLNLSGALAARGELEESLAAGLTAAKLRPDSAGAYANIGNALVRLGRFKEAEQHLRRGREIDPRHRNTLHNLAVALEKQERYAEALAVYQDVARLDPKGLRPLRNRARMLIRMQRYADVVELLEPVVAELPGASPSGQPGKPIHARLHAQASLAARKLGRFDDAEKHYRHAMNLAPKEARLLRAFAESLKDHGDYEEAVEWYRVVIERDRRSGLAHAGLGEALLHLQRYDKAVVRLTEAAALLPTSDTAGVHVLLARAREAQGRPEAAEEQYERALAVEPRHLDALKRLASLRARQQRLDETLDLLRTLVEVEPDNAEVLLNLGIVLHHLGRSREALRSLDNALSLEPSLERAQTVRDAIRQSLENKGP